MHYILYIFVIINYVNYFNYVNYIYYSFNDFCFPSFPFRYDAKYDISLKPEAYLKTVDWSVKYPW